MAGQPTPLHSPPQITAPPYQGLMKTHWFPLILPYQTLISAGGGMLGLVD